MGRLIKIILRQQQQNTAQQQVLWVWRGKTFTLSFSFGCLSKEATEDDDDDDFLCSGFAFGVERKIDKIEDTECQSAEPHTQQQQQMWESQGRTTMLSRTFGRVYFGVFIAWKERENPRG